MKRKASSTSFGSASITLSPRHPSWQFSPSMNYYSMPPLLTSPTLSSASPSTWLVIGASRGIGLEFTRQLLAQGHQVIAAVRDVTSAAEIWKLAAGGHSPSPSPASSHTQSPYLQSPMPPEQQQQSHAMAAPFIRPGSCIMEQCDVTSEIEIDSFIGRMWRIVERGGRIENVVLNAGILRYEQGLGAMNVGMEELLSHLRTNCVGPITIARKLLQLNDYLASTMPSSTAGAGGIAVGKKVIFISSDSGSMLDFREFEDGFAAYAASKVALNMMMRHLAAELKRKAAADAKTGSEAKPARANWEKEVCVLAVHPGEVQTDMANIDVGWEVEGIISPEESVRDMLKVISTKNAKDSGTFWCWDGREHPW